MKLNEKEYAFLEKEFGYDKNQIDSLSDDELLEVGDRCFDVEIEETILAGDDDLSERGEIAAELVTKINE